MIALYSLWSQHLTVCVFAVGIVNEIEVNLHQKHFQFRLALWVSLQKSSEWRERKKSLLLLALIKFRIRKWQDNPVWLWQPFVLYKTYHHIIEEELLPLPEQQRDFFFSKFRIANSLYVWDSYPPQTSHFHTSIGYRI